MNNYLTNVGFSLAKTISSPDKDVSIYDYLGEGCNGSPVDEQEIIRTVQQFKLPVFNGGDKCVFTNHISLLMQFSKILVKINNARLENFLNRYDFFCPSQYGFIFNKI